MKKKQKPAPAAGFTHINNWGKRSKIAALPGFGRLRFRH